MNIKQRFKLVIVIMSFFIIYIKFVIPDYPQLNSDNSVEEIKNSIAYIVKDEMRNISIENLDGTTRGALPVEHIKAYKIFLQKLIDCKNSKECILNVYNNHMDHWGSNTMRKNIKALYMIKRFGIVGEHINKNFGWIY